MNGKLAREQPNPSPMLGATAVVAQLAVGTIKVPQRTATLTDMGLNPSCSIMKYAATSMVKH